MQDISERVYVGHIDSHELTQFFQGELHNAMFTSPVRMDLPNSDNPDVSLIFSSDGTLTQVLSVLADQELNALIAKLEAIFRGTTELKVRRFVSFSAMPVRGSWSCEALTITPAPANAPRPGTLVGDFPLIIEIPFEATGEAIVDLRRAERARYKYELVLSLFIPLLETTVRNLKFMWGIVSDPNRPIEDPPVPVVVQSFYSIPNFELFAATRTESGPSIPTVPDNEYYSEARSGIRMDQELDVPESLTTWMNGFESLHETEQRKLLRSAYWLRHAHDVSTLSQSAALVAAVQAIEVLVPATSGEQCPTCKREIGPGPTKKFKDFLEEYAPSTSTDEKKARGLLYAERSKLTHGHTLLASDADMQMGWVAPAHAFDSQMLRSASRVVRVAAINWLDKAIHSSCS